MEILSNFQAFQVLANLKIGGFSLSSTRSVGDVKKRSFFFIYPDFKPLTNRLGLESLPTAVGMICLSLFLKKRKKPSYSTFAPSALTVVSIFRSSASVAGCVSFAPIARKFLSPMFCPSGVLMQQSLPI